MNKDILEQVQPAGSILMAYRGSHAYGTYICPGNEESIDDIDLMGVYVESPDFYLGLDHKTLGFGGNKTDTQEYWIDNYDIVNYELRKLFGLLLKSNPNVLMLLFLNKEHIISKDPLWDKIVENKDIFLSSKAYYSFKGYAEAQLKKMTNFVYQGYMGEKRRALVDKFGFDLKNGAHLIRLLKMCSELLDSGELFVDRTGIDASQIISIKKGEWSLGEVSNYAKILFEEIDTKLNKTSLPEKPNFDLANELCTSIIIEYYERIGNAD